MGCEYRHRVDGASRAKARGRRHLRVGSGLPIPDGAGFKKSFPIVNRVLEAVVKDAKASTYVGTDLLADAHGPTRRYLRVQGSSR